MKKKASIFGWALAALGFAQPVWAQNTPPILSGKSTVAIFANVPPVCTLSTPSATGDGELKQLTDTGFSLTLGQIAGADGLAMQSSSQLTYTNATCNFMASLSLVSEKGGLQPTGASVPPGFAAVIHYTATATWGKGGPQTKLDTSKNALKGDNNAVAVAPRSDELILLIDTKAGALPLVNVGSPYSDTLSLQIGAAL